MKKKKATTQNAHRMRDLLPNILNQLTRNYEKKPNRVIEAWPQIIGEKLSPMTKVSRFENGILVVKVKSSTLYSLLSQHEKGRLLNLLQQNFSEKIVLDIIFKIG